MTNSQIDQTESQTESVIDRFMVKKTQMRTEKWSKALVHRWIVKHVLAEKTCCQTDSVRYKLIDSGVMSGWWKSRVTDKHIQIQTDN